MSLIKIILLALLLIATPALADQDDTFLAARDAFRSGDARKLASLSPRLQHTPMEVYTAYYQLRLELRTVDIKQIRAFLSRPDDTPLIDRMRAEWLKSLAEKQQWDVFDSEYPRLINRDIELNCYALQSGMRNLKQTALQEAHDLWFNTKDMPDSCNVPFEAAIAAGIISQQDIWQRMKDALESGKTALAKKLAPRLTGTLAVSETALDQAMENPARYLTTPALSHTGERMVALFALQRLARQSPDLASEQWLNLEKHFPVSEQHYFLSWLAFEAARKHDPRALQWYRQAGKTPLNDQQSAWRVRAALRVQNWPEVLSSINAMPETLRKEAGWQYWKARALLALDRRAEAMAIFAPLSAEPTFYGQLANEELADTPVLSVSQTGHQADKKDIAEIEQLPGVQRAIAFYRMDLRTDALREWNWVIRNFNDSELIAASEIAKRNEMYDRAINTADKTVRLHDFSLRYLAPFRPAMREHIKENNLEEAWVYGLMRQESRFVTSAKSGVGASGLMQVMPTTARWIAKKLGLKNYQDSMLHQLDTNLTLGTYYMKNMLSSLDDSPVLASAAYNAGPGRARRWRAETPLEGAIYAETIQFDETRDYVKKVMSNTVYYARQFGAPPRSLKQRVGIIAGRPADASLMDDKSPGAAP